MAKELAKQHAVQSSNLESIGFYFGTESAPQSGVIRVAFKRGASYDYWPCTQEEFQKAFASGVKISEWFNAFKTGKSFKKLE